MTRIAIIGYGFIGQAHVRALSQLDAELAAIVEPEKVKREKAENDINALKTTWTGAKNAHAAADLETILQDDTIDCISLCVPTPLHAELTEKAVKAGKHIVCEKPMALTLQECDRMIEAAKAHDKMLFIAQCIRFWPEYRRLKSAIDRNEFGELVNLSMRRIAPPPSWASWFTEASQSGGALFDLHVHDVDFIQYVLGKPKALFSQGISNESGAITSVFTQYQFDRSLICSAEGSWAYPTAFKMTFSALFSEGLLEYDSSRDPSLLLWKPKHTDPIAVKVESSDGYIEEFKYFLSCLQKGEPLTEMEPSSARTSIELALAEMKSIQSGTLYRL
jgi:predicted dehydrogenase